MSELDRRYYDLETHFLATTPRCASNSIKELHKDLPLRTAEYVHRNRGDKLCYGVLRDPFDRLRSTYKLLAPKYKHGLTFDVMFEELADNPHVIQQTDLHRGTVDIWLPFEDFVSILPVHLRKSLDTPVPTIDEDRVREFYREDFDARRSIEVRTSSAYIYALGVGSGGAAPERGGDEGEYQEDWIDGRSDGLVQPGPVPSSSGEAEGASSEGAEGDDSPSSDLGGERSGNLWGTDFYGGSLEADAEPPSESGEGEAGL